MDIREHETNERLCQWEQTWARNCPVGFVEWDRDLSDGDELGSTFYMNRQQRLWQRIEPCSTACRQDPHCVAFEFQAVGASTDFVSQAIWRVFDEERAEHLGQLECKLKRSYDKRNSTPQAYHGYGRMMESWSGGNGWVSCLKAPVDSEGRPGCRHDWNFLPYTGWVYGCWPQPGRRTRLEDPNAPRPAPRPVSAPRWDSSDDMHELDWGERGVKDEETDEDTDETENLTSGSTVLARFERILGQLEG